MKSMRRFRGNRHDTEQMHIDSESFAYEVVNGVEL